MADDYITLTELANSLSIGTGETYADADMTAAITAASREVDRRCGRKFWSDNTTRYYTPSHPRVLWIDDVKSSVTVDVDMNGDGTYETSLVQGTDFVLEPLNAAADGFPWTTITLRRRSAAVFYPSVESSVRVGGQFGWAAVPSAVKQATSILASRFLKRVREAPFGVAGFGIDGGAVRVSSFDPDVDALLSAYVRVNHS